MTLLVGVPAALGLLCLALPILATLMKHGAFGVHDALMSARSLRAFAVGLVAFMLIKVLASAFYAKQAIKIPVKIAAVALLVNVLLNFLLIGPLAHAGLALATALAAWVNVALLLWVLHREGQSLRVFLKGFFMLRVAGAALGMALYVLWAQAAPAWWLSAHLMQRVGHLAWLLLSGFILYFVLLYVFGVRQTVLSAPHID
jgi:putative peptidoglycan lipid II flippase